MSGLVFKYGSYSHPAGEVYPQIIELRPVVNDRGVRWAIDYRMQVAGSFCADPATPLTPSDINTRIAAMRAAYGWDYQDFGFYFPGTPATPTDHVLETNHTANLSGNKVISTSWDHQTPAEFANTRSFTISLGARLLSSVSSVMYFREVVSQRGTGGPRWTFRERWQGIPIREDISENTPVYLTQRGVVVGTSSSIAPPPPWWPTDELEEFREVERVSPRHHGHPGFDRPTHYVVQYAYYFARATSPNQNPNVWYP